MNIEYIKPTLLDIEAMQKVVAKEVLNGIILDRNKNEMATTIRSYTIAKKESEIIGFVALHIHTETLAEIRSLIVREDLRNIGVGKNLINQAIQEAKSLNAKEVLTLTYHKEFFEKLGFKEISKESIPDSKIWADCIKCKHFPICNEISLIKEI